MKNKMLVSAVVWLGLAAAIFSRPQTEEEARKIVDSLKWREGSIALENGIAHVNLRDGYRFVDGADAGKILTELWGNPPSQMLGMMFPAGDGPLDTSFAVIIEGFANEGYVKDDEADKLDPAKLLKELQEGQAAENAERKQQGFAELEIVGWAVPPRYDREAKKIFWALDIKRVGSEHHSVNYYVRILGRRGYLVLNALGGLDQVREIEAATPQVLSMVEFNEGHRYADFDEKKGDKVATYGIAGLILGAAGLKVAAKVGLLALFAKKFGVVLLFMKKFIVFIIAGIAALFSKIKSIYSARKTGEDSLAGPQA